MKKIINYLAIVLIAIFGLSLNVLAINTGANNVVTDNGTITITGAGTGDTFKAYKMLDITYDSSTHQTGYSFTTTFKTFLDSTSNYNTSSFTPQNYANLIGGASPSADDKTYLETLVAKYKKYIKDNNIVGQDFDSNNKLTTAAGAYLVVATSQQRIYSLMVGNLELVANGNDYGVQDVTINAKSTENVISGGDNGGEPVVINGTYGEGDTITYDVDVTVPDYPATATNTTFVVTANIPETIEFSGLNTVKVKIGNDTYDVVNNEIRDSENKKIADVVMLDDDNHITTTPQDADKVQVTFDTDNISGPVTIEFKGTLKSDPDVGAPSNEVTVDVEYASDPYGLGTTTTSVDFGIVTYGIKVQLSRPSGAGTGFITNVNADTLAGAVFKVYSCSDSTCASKTDTNNTITTNESGYGELGGLKAGSYYIEQTRAIAGYRLLTPRTIQINNTSVNSSNYYILNLELENAGLLPSTGGIGTLLFTIIGILTIGMAFYFIIDYRKKKANASAN